MANVVMNEYVWPVWKTKHNKLPPEAGPRTHVEPNNGFHAYNIRKLHDVIADYEYLDD